jgi:hypothetical protein
MKLSEQIQQASNAGLIDDFGWAADAAAMEDQIAAVKDALREYHCGRDRYPAGVNSRMFRLSRSIETIFETPYVPGSTTPTETGAES